MYVYMLHYGLFIFTIVLGRVLSILIKILLGLTQYRFFFSSQPMVLTSVFKQTIDECLLCQQCIIYALESMH